jgi:hypothetical protein
MNQYEFCELWWADGFRPQLTFYKPDGTQTVAVGEVQSPEDNDSWDALKSAMVELGLSGWELVSATHGTGGLFFKRNLQ